jgi:hypothetical protein
MGASLASMPIEAQIFSADGSPMGGRIRVFSPTDSAGRYQWRPCVAAAADGRSWLGWHGGADPTAVFGRRFTADGRVASPKLRVSRRTRSAAAIGPPSLAIDPQSGWALFGWTERVAAGRLAMARLFHPMGNPAGGPFVVGAAQGGGASRLGRQASAAQGNGVFLLVFVDRDGHLVGQRAQADPRQPIRGRE